MNYLKISARNTSSFASIRPFNLVYIVFNWDRPLWRPLAHINDTNLYVNFENSGRAHSWALRPLHLGSLVKVTRISPQKRFQYCLTLTRCKKMSSVVSTVSNWAQQLFHQLPGNNWFCHQGKKVIYCYKENCFTDFLFFFLIG